MDAIYRQNFGITYPLLLRGSPVGTLYGFDRGNYAVIDHLGVLRYRSSGSISRRYDDSAVRNAISLALEDLQIAREAETKVEEPAVEDPPDEATNGGEMTETPPDENPMMPPAEETDASESTEEGEIENDTSMRPYSWGQVKHGRAPVTP